MRALERDGLLTRTVTPSIPPRVDYELTRPGRSPLEPVSELSTWARKNRAAIVAARERFDGGYGAVKKVIYAEGIFRLRGEAGDCAAGS